MNGAGVFLLSTDLLHSIPRVIYEVSALEGEGLRREKRGKGTALLGKGKEGKRERWEKRKRMEWCVAG